MEDQLSFRILVYAVFFILAFGFTILLNLLLLRFLKNMGTSPNGVDLVRWAAEHKPLIGGISFFIVFLLSVSSYPILPFGTEDFLNRKVFALLGCASVGFLMGFIDDALTISPAMKFLAQICCAAIMISCGIYIEICSIPILDYLFSTLWVVGIMNSINMLDNMDGITASVSLGILLGILGIVLLSSSLNSFFVIVIVGIVASLLGFLTFNWHPAKLYMGDGGSQYLGAVLAYLSILFLWNFKATPSGFDIQQFILPLVAFMLPLFDTTTVFFRRILRGQSPFQGGRDHTTHHFAYFGFSDRQVSSIFALISLLSAISVCIIFSGIGSWSDNKSLLVIGILLLLFCCFQWVYQKGKRKALSLKRSI